MSWSHREVQEHISFSLCQSFLENRWIRVPKWGLSQRRNSKTSHLHHGFFSPHNIIEVRVSALTNLALLFPPKNTMTSLQNASSESFCNQLGSLWLGHDESSFFSQIHLVHFGLLSDKVQSDIVAAAPTEEIRCYGIINTTAFKGWSICKTHNWNWNKSKNISLYIMCYRYIKGSRDDTIVLLRVHLCTCWPISWSVQYCPTQVSHIDRWRRRFVLFFMHDLRLLYFYQWDRTMMHFWG